MSKSNELRCSECRKKIAVSINNMGDKYLGRSVIQFTLQGEEKARFKSIVEAFKKTGVNQTNITKCCSGKQQTAGGYIWQYSVRTKKSELYEIISDYIDDCYRAGKTDAKENIKKFLKENKNMKKEQVEKIYHDINDNFIE